MPTFNPSLNLAALRDHLLKNEGLLVVCYCAQWCDSCKTYQPDFDMLAERYPQHTFIWVDIEENPELLGDEDVENFPTILIQSKTANHFYGPLLPYISHLEKILSRIDVAATVTDGPPLLRPLLAAAAQ